jgi:glycosyltransferase involved in cell wall biosynthesis
MSIVITVGVVARNEQAHIGDTLRSLLSLDFPQERYEIIVVDGNSSDRTREIAATVLGGSAVRHQVLNENDFGGQGLCFARNIVIDRSADDAQFIAFIDGDCIAERQWLLALYTAMTEADEIVAGAGGARFIAPTEDPKEIVINAFLTSRIGSGFNPVFSNQRAKWVRSIANYNAIYRKQVLASFRYDESLVVSDDNEINYRITRGGLLFRFVPQAKVYHRETNSVGEFARNMFRYGENIANAMRKHRTMMRPFVPFSLGLLLYLIALPFLYIRIGSVTLFPLGAYAVLWAGVLLEVVVATRSIHTGWVLLLFPFQHLSYAMGVIVNLVFKPVFRHGS